MAPLMVPVKLSFDNPRSLLSDYQLRAGQSCSWFHIDLDNAATAADLADQIVQSFNIDHACPRGIQLYKDEVLVPPFESTKIFRENDVIRVRKRAGGTHGQRMHKRTKKEDICDIE